MILTWLTDNPHQEKRCSTPTYAASSTAPR
jgi:hypothetical protein